MDPAALIPPPAFPRRKITAEEYSKTPEGPPYMQLIDGEYYVSESPVPKHQTISGKLHLLLGNWAERSRAGSIWCAPLDVYLSQYDVVQPDLFFISNARLPKLLGRRIHGPPDLVVEILSPSTSTLDLGKKRALYARSGVPELWIVDPESRQVRIYRFAEDTENPISVLRQGEKLASPILSGFEANVSDIFSG